jgi:hypothetical protein
MSFAAPRISSRSWNVTGLTSGRVFSTIAFLSTSPLTSTVLYSPGAEADHAPCPARLKPDPRADKPAARRLSRSSVDELVEHRIDAIAEALQQMAQPDVVELAAGCGNMPYLT